MAHATPEDVRRVEVMLGTALRRQTEMINVMRDISAHMGKLDRMLMTVGRTIQGLAELEKRIARTMGEHDKWERSR